MAIAVPFEPVTNDVRKGFVYKRVPHVMLGSIANNRDIQAGMTQAEIDAIIARHAEPERLFDQQHEDPKRVRVTGPFTVESMTPHRMLSGELARPDTEEVAQTAAEAGEFDQLVIEHLRKNKVQTGIKGWTIDFERLDSYAGEWLQAVGEFREADGTMRTAAVSIGPRYGTVTREQVKEAAKEAVKGIGHDVLLVCGLAFNPDVSEEAKLYGKLRVLIVRMNPDLALFNQDLKNTGTGNLFMVLGEPDITIEKQPDCELVVEIKGLDIYDPTTGQIRNSSTDDIACWFIDTNYNGESFFVRHAYFTGAGNPYDKLKRALKAEINEEAWASLYSTRSRPFARPETGKIAVKVINHYGDEVLKVYEVR
jgi:adenine-specific DNA-methyltransferase